jgi:uncharacterized protein YndB with AHSA1/START domain
MIDENLTVTKTIEINSSPSSVWEALTNPDKIKLYLFGTEVISDWKTGSHIVFQGEYQGQQYKDGGTILAIEPEKLLQYTYWSGFSGLENKEENYSTVTYTLDTKGNQTTLTLIQKGFANKQAREHTDQNWTMVLEKIKEIATANSA